MLREPEAKHDFRMVRAQKLTKPAMHTPWRRLVAEHIVPRTTVNYDNQTVSTSNPMSEIFYVVPEIGQYLRDVSELWKAIDALIGT